MVNKLYELGFRENPPEPCEGVSSDRTRLFLQEYQWLRKQPCDRLANKLGYYPFMKDELSSELALNGRDTTYLDKIKVETIKELWVKKAIDHNPIWANRIAHWVLWHDPQWFDCFRVEIKVDKVTHYKNGKMILVILNPFPWELWINQKSEVTCFRKVNRPSNNSEENHAWKSCVILDPSQEDVRSPWSNLAYIPNKIIMEQIKNGR